MATDGSVFRSTSAGRFWPKTQLGSSPAAVSSFPGAAGPGELFIPVACGGGGGEGVGEGGSDGSFPAGKGDAGPGGISSMAGRLGTMATVSARGPNTGRVGTG
jgi:hypothetical protein